MHVLLLTTVHYATDNIRPSFTIAFQPLDRLKSNSIKIKFEIIIKKIEVFKIKLRFSD